MRKLLNCQAAMLAFSLAGAFFAPETAFGQDAAAKPGLSLSGSIDTYYKYDLAKTANIGTSFGDEQASFSVGMFNLIAAQEVGKASFVADIGVGPRNAGSAGDGLNASIQNLYVSYQFTEKLSLSAGYMGTFVGYEVISPTANFNYSTSYLFTNGPFQNAGVRLSYAISDKVGIMAGVFNDWNTYTDSDGKPDFGAQLSLSPVEGWSAYLNFVTGEVSGTIFDLTTSYQITDKFLLGLNAASYSAPDDGGAFQGAALYMNYAFTDGFALGFRGETFTDDKLGILMAEEKSSVNAFTLSANVTSGPLRFIPELRLDAAQQDIFSASGGDASKTAVQLLVAAVYSF
jgi:hypothetical protein